MEINATNCYSLLGRDDPKRKAVVKSAEADLNSMIKTTAEWYDDIRKNHPKVGIGDTATDEAIAHRFYHAIHFREIPE